MLKNAYFLKKNCKKSPQRRGLRPRARICLRRLGAPPPDLHVITLAYY